MGDLNNELTIVLQTKLTKDIFEMKPSIRQLRNLCIYSQFLFFNLGFKKYYILPYPIQKEREDM